MSPNYCVWLSVHSSPEVIRVHLQANRSNFNNGEPLGSELAWCKDSVLRVITENTSCRRYILRRFIDLHSRHCSLVSMTGQIPYLIRSALKFNGGCLMGVQILTSLLFNIKLLDLALDKRIHAHVR